MQSTPYPSPYLEVSALPFGKGKVGKKQKVVSTASTCPILPYRKIKKSQPFSGKRKLHVLISRRSVLSPIAVSCSRHFEQMPTLAGSTFIGCLCYSLQWGACGFPKLLKIPSCCPGLNFPWHLTWPSNFWEASRLLCIWLIH